MFDDDENTTTLTKIEFDSPLSVVLLAPLHLKRLENVSPLQLVQDFFSRQTVVIDLRDAGLVDLCDAPDQFAVCFGQVGSPLRSQFTRGVRRVRFLVDIIGKAPKNRLYSLVNTLRGFFHPTTVFEMELSAKCRQQSVHKFHVVFTMSDYWRWEHVALAAKLYNGDGFYNGVDDGLDLWEHRERVLSKVSGFVHRV